MSWLVVFNLDLSLESEELVNSKTLGADDVGDIESLLASLRSPVLYIASGNGSGVYSGCGKLGV